MSPSDTLIGGAEGQKEEHEQRPRGRQGQAGLRAGAKGAVHRHRGGVRGFKETADKAEF